MPQTQPERMVVDAVPALVVHPTAGPRRRSAALFLPFLGGTKETVLPHLRTLADEGFTAVSLDPWRMGERGDGQHDRVMAEVFAGFRAHMWPMLGQTVLDAVHVLDTVIDRYDLDDLVVAGGLSMGGDIAVALAGIDPRVRRVAAVVATPDWTRPGMRAVDDPERRIDQGRPTPYGAWLYERLDPMTNLDAFTRDVAIAFELGELDTHVPPEAAVRFRDELARRDATAPERIRVTLHPGLDHVSAVRTPSVTARALDWLRSS